ncbi:MAG: cation:proton antiporter [Methanomicrobiales archaeon]|nr:cation:proton antiporter [Methanomicrobiales archaeon]
MEEIALALLICLALAVISRRFAVPPIPFYIIAGLVAGNLGLEVLRNSTISTFFSHMGLVFLLFYSGLEFKPERFLSRGSDFLKSGLLDLNLNMAIGFLAALLTGLSPFESFVIASAFLDTSSAVAVSSLIENRRLVAPESETIVWLLIFEDLIMVFLIFFISTEVQNPFVLIVKIGGVVILVFALIRLFARKILSLVRRTDEIPALFTFTSVLSATGASLYLAIPEAVPVIALGSALSRTNPVAFERIATPFKDIFLVIFFFFFGASVSFKGGFSPVLMITITLTAIGAKLFSGMVIGWVLHHSRGAGVEIAANTVARGEFAVAIAAIYGSAVVSGAVAVMVIVTSIFGVFMAKYSEKIREYIGPG